MSNVARNIKQIIAHLPEDVALVAVSKFHPADAIYEAYNAGQRAFGESRAQELTAKAAVLPADIQWHFIGHLQTNKVASVVPIASLIQSVDSLRLLTAINSHAARIGKVQDVLLQVHVALEETKFGFSPDEIPEAVNLASRFNNVRLRGIMAMASNVDNLSRVRDDFSLARNTFLYAQSLLLPQMKPHFTILSMGMSDDYRLAIEEGSNLIRVGSGIFGNRE